METAAQQNIQLSGEVAAVIYRNGENGYVVLRLRTPQEGVVTVTGCIPGAAPGEQLLLTGSWTTHPSYGPQFSARTAERAMPESAAAIYAFLSAGSVKGIGPTLAKGIVDAFGSQALEVMETEPEKLAQIRGISPRRAAEIGAAFARQAGLRRLMEFLGAAGIGPRVAVRLYRCYGSDARPAVEDNPYLITDDFFGADFAAADELALRLGFEADSPVRVEAAVLFELRHNLNNGHTFLPQDKLAAAVCQLIGIDSSLAMDALDTLEECGSIVRCEIAGLTACYLDTIYDAECSVARRLLEMAAFPYEKLPGGLAAAIGHDCGLEFAGAQKQAVELAGACGILVLTGGPGTGKTTTVRGILGLFDKIGLETVLAAPTGKAAKRLSEVTGREAKTIHRLLGAGWSEEAGGETVFERCASDPLDCDAVILDESSMVDIRLMDALLQALRPGCRLVMVGDADQLPSVGPGNVFSDIIRSGAVPVIRLTDVFRQAQASAIVKNAHRIDHGLMPQVEQGGDFFILSRQTAEKTAETIAQLCAVRLPKNMGIDPSQIQVLSPTRKHASGTGSLNRILREAVNPPADGKTEIAAGETLFRTGDRVMQIRNNYDILWKNADGTEAGCGIFNGDTGLITSIDHVREVVTVDFDGRLADYTFDMLCELEPAFAITVHKAQGSEYRAVILAAASGAPVLLTRSVLYTAVTRARDLLIIVGEPSVLEKMVSDDRRQRRYSGLKTRLCAYAEQ